MGDALSVPFIVSWLYLISSLILIRLLIFIIIIIPSASAIT